jgi:hypothetical protein
MVNSRQKGAREERALCDALREALNWNCRRSQQFSGAGETADILIEGISNLFVESKAVEKLSIHPVMEKAVSQSGTKLAVVCHKKKRTEWLVTMRLSDWLAISRLVASTATQPEPPAHTLPSDTT